MELLRGLATKILGTTNPAAAGVFTATIREPLGVCAVITPWNFPLTIASWKLAPALACGNAVVHKPAPEAPLTRCGSRSSPSKPASPRAC